MGTHGLEIAAASPVHHQGINDTDPTTAWWFGTCFMTFHSVGNVIIPTDELIFVRGVGQPPTSYYFHPMKYPLVNCHKTMENHNFKGVNHMFLWVNHNF